MSQIIEAEGLKVGAVEMSLAWVITTYARLQGSSVDRLFLHDLISKIPSRISQLCEDNNQEIANEIIKNICADLGVDSIDVCSPDPARLPSIIWVSTDQGWGIVRAQAPDGGWLIETTHGVLKGPALDNFQVLRVNFKKSNKAIHEKPAYQLFLESFKLHKKNFVEAGSAGVLINLLALATSLYSMQVYDRVIPTQGYSTLFVLTLGVFIAILFEFLVKIARSYIIESISKNIDEKISRDVFSRLLNIRLDQLPSSVGSLSAQIRGYETIRGFLSGATFYFLVDAPFAVIFLVVIAMIATPWVAVVPLLFLMVAVALGISVSDKMELHAKSSNAAGNLKTGILVEAIEGSETIKAGAGSWSMLSKWLDVTDEAMKHDIALRNLSDKNLYFSAFIQQLGYVLLITVGAVFAASGSLTQGGLIACSILSGRVLAPIAQIPGLMLQKAHAKAALDGLEKIFALETDNHDVDHPLVPEKLNGAYFLERVRFSYPGTPKALSVQQLLIQPGEKIGVVGPIGAGKSTMLRLLSGMYQVQSGRILLDGLDIEHLSRHFIGENIGYLQQEHRLFSGTLRENLLVGIPDPGDEVIRDTAQKTGLLEIIAQHPKGLGMIIAEGGKGLSGGQRQLVALTRVLLGNPSVWLLDEPTASMDEQTEQRCIALLKATLRPEHTTIIVSHKASLLSLVDRILVVANHQIVLDGPKDDVLAKLSGNAATSN